MDLSKLIVAACIFVSAKPSFGAKADDINQIIKKDSSMGFNLDDEINKQESMVAELVNSLSKDRKEKFKNNVARKSDGMLIELLEKRSVDQKSRNF